MDAALLGSLIGDLYDAAVDPLLWSGIAARIAAAFQSTSAVVKLHGGEEPFQLVEMTSNLVVPDRLSEWAARWHRHDLWVERSVGFGMNRIVTDEMLITPEEQQKSGFYREWLRYLEIHHMVGAVFPAGDAVGVLGIHRPREAGAFTAEDRQSVDLLLPHLQRALGLGQRFAQASVERILTSAALDRIETGVLVLNRAAQLVYANDEGERILMAGEALTLKAGRVCAMDPLVQDSLMAVVRDAVGPNRRGSLTANPVLVLPRPGRLPMSLAALPLGAHASSFGPAEPHLLLFLRDPERREVRAEHLASLFGLTPTEAAIAAELSAGRSPDEIAKLLQIAVGTVRWHVKRILAKTGTARQPELVALLLRSAAALPD